VLPVLPQGRDWRRLEVLLDRSWEKESITWTGLTWWDPLPCGQDFVVQVTRYLQPPLPSPALSLLCNPPTPKLSLSHLTSFPPRLQVRSLSTSYSLSEVCPLANPSPESYQSVFSTSPDYAFPPTPSSSPLLLSQPSAHPVGFPTPPDSVPRKMQDQARNPTTRRIFDFPCTSSDRILSPPLYQPFTVPPPPPFHVPPPPSSTSSYLPVMVDRPPPSY